MKDNSIQPLVTIGIPTYNRADIFLRNALESAINQTYKNIEIIVSDNCSQDNTESLVKTYSNKCIRYFRQSENIAANDNFNFCLEKANGKYFLLLHDDDLVDNDFIESCIQAIDGSEDVGIIRTGTRVIDSQGRVLSERKNIVGSLPTNEFFLAWFKSKTDLYLCSTLFNTERLKEIGGFNSKHQLFQDVLAETTLAAKYGRVDVQEIKASFRKHAMQNTALSKIDKWCEDSIFLLENMCTLVPEKQAILKTEGMKKFARHNYNIAIKINSVFMRYIAYYIIYKSFNFKYPPPIMGRFRKIIKKYII